MELIQSININKFQDAIQQVGKGPCVKFNCERQQECADQRKLNVRHLDIGSITILTLR